MTILQYSYNHGFCWIFHDFDRFSTSFLHYSNTSEFLDLHFPIFLEIFSNFHYFPEFFRIYCYCFEFTAIFSIYIIFLNSPQFSKLLNRKSLFCSYSESSLFRSIFDTALSKVGVFLKFV